MNSELSRQLRNLAGWFRLTNSLAAEPRENCAKVCEEAAQALEARESGSEENDE